MADVARPLDRLAEEDHRCADCAFVYEEVSVDAAAEAVRGVPDRVRAALVTKEDMHVRTRPDDGVWSAVEYLCHLRDVYAVYTIRLYRTRVEDVPILEPMLNDLRAARFRYNQRDIRPVLAELVDHVAGFLDEVARNGEATWGRRARRLPGEERSARWLVRQAAHEGIHHTRDIADVLARVRASGG